MANSLGRKLGFSWNFTIPKRSDFLREEVNLRSKFSVERFSSIVKVPHIMATQSSSSEKVQLYPKKTPLISDFWKGIFCRSSAGSIAIPELLLS
jgi:hypothetical protein